jgi:hypothetical protein
VQRLVHVADEVDQKDEGFAPRGGRSGRVGESLAEIGDFGDHAIALGAIPRHIEVRLGDGDVDVVPGRGLGARVANLVGPTGNRGGHGGARSEDFDHPGMHPRRELRFGDAGNQGVPLGTPGAERRAGRQRGEEAKSSHESPIISAAKPAPTFHPQPNGGAHRPSFCNARITIALYRCATPAKPDWQPQRRAVQFGERNR